MDMPPSIWAEWKWRVYAISDARNEVQVQVGRPTSGVFEELKTWLYYALLFCRFWCWWWWAFHSSWS